MMKLVIKVSKLHSFFQFGDFFFLMIFCLEKKTEENCIHRKLCFS